MKVLDPLAIRNVRLSSWGILNVVSVDEANVDFPLLQNLEQRNPVHARGLHCDRSNAAFLQPFSQPVQIDGEGLKTSNRFRIPVGRYGHEYLRCTNIDSGCVGLDNRQTYSFAALPGHACLLVAPQRRPGPCKQGSLPNEMRHACQHGGHHCIEHGARNHTAGRALSAPVSPRS